MAEHDDLLVRQAASDVYRRYRQYYTVELEDLQQEGYEFWYMPSSQTMIESRQAQSDDWREYVFVALRNHMKRYAERQKAYELGYEFFEQHRYTQRQVRRLLPYALDDEGAVLAAKTQDAPAKGNPSEGGDTLAMLADVRWALGQLGPYDRDVVRVHCWGLADDYARARDVTSAAVGRQFYRVVGKLVELLNWHRGEGSN